MLTKEQRDNRDQISARAAIEMAHRDGKRAAIAVEECVAPEDAVFLFLQACFECVECDVFRASLFEYSVVTRAILLLAEQTNNTSAVNRASPSLALLVCCYMHQQNQQLEMCFLAT